LPAQKNAITIKTYYLSFCGGPEKDEVSYVMVISTRLFSKVNDGFFIIHLGMVKTVQKI